MRIIDEAKADFELYKTNPDKYAEKVRMLGKKLGIELRSDFLPTYFGGNYENKKIKYAFNSLNPKYIPDKTKQCPEGKTRFEENLKTKDWNTCHSFLKNCFKEFSEHGINYSHFAKLINLFSGLENWKKKDNPNHWEWYHDNYINLDLIPYYSDSTSTIKANDETQKYLCGRLEDNIELIFSSSLRPRLICFNGKIYETLLPHIAGLIKVEDFRFQGKKISLNIHMFKLSRGETTIPVVQFGAFIPNLHGMFSDDLTNIGCWIRERIGS